MLQPDWQGRWIFNPACEDNAAPVFRKRIQLVGAPGSAELRICGLGFYVLRVNGRRVGDELLQPAFSAYDKTVYYNKLDLRSFLQVGENELQVTLGNGWYNQQQPDAWQFEHAAWHAKPRLVCELYLDGELAAASDSSWECAESPITFNSLRCGETCDARHQPDNWIPAAVTFGPGGGLVEQTIQPIRLAELIEPVTTLPAGRGKIFDFGVNLSGNVEIRVRGKAGDRVHIQYAETARTNGSLDLEQIKGLVFDRRFQRDEYILSGEGEEVWHSEFGYNGFRFAQVVCNCELLKVTARCFHTELKDLGGIESDNEQLNRIQGALRRSTLTNFHHIPTDCPHREKNGWTADAYLSCEQALYNFDMQGAYLKWLGDIVDCQLPSGQIPCIAP
ncbi:MAG: family 78 glycoside hydrolase catalytic domain, partial [Anaerolineae bacterium]